MNKRRKSESKSTAASRFSVYLFELCIWIIRLFGEGDITVFVLSLALVLEKHRVSQRLDDCCIFIRWLFYCCFRLKWYRWRRERKTHCWLLFGGCCYASFLASYPNHSKFFSLQCCCCCCLMFRHMTRAHCVCRKRGLWLHIVLSVVCIEYLFLFICVSSILLYMLSSSSSAYNWTPFTKITNQMCGINVFSLCLMKRTQILFIFIDGFGMPSMSMGIRFLAFNFSRRWLKTSKLHSMHLNIQIEIGFSLLELNWDGKTGFLSNIFEWE